MSSRLAFLIVSASLLVGCYGSRSIHGDATLDTIAVDTVSDSSTEPDVDISFDPIFEPDAVDMVEAEWDGYTPETCSWFWVDVEWDHSEDVYEREPYFRAPGDPLLHVISIYEVRDCPHHSMCPIEVHVPRTYRPIVLALSSYEPAEWVIRREEGATINQIILYGHYEQMASGVDDVPVVNKGPSTYLGHCWPRCGGEDTAANIVDAEETSGLPLATFHGAYDIAELTLRHICNDECLPERVCSGLECGLIPECYADCGTCPEHLSCIEHRCVVCEPDCSGRECGHDGCDGSCGACPEDFVCYDGGCVEAPYYTGCESVASESHYCLTVVDDGAAVVGLDTGMVCPIGKRDHILSPHTPYGSSLAFLDGHLHQCVDESIMGMGVHGILRYSILDGSWEWAPVLCYGLARWRSGLVIQPDMSFGPASIEYYPSWARAMARSPEPIPGDFSGFDFTIQGDTAYSLGRSSLDGYSLLTGTLESSVVLEESGLSTFGGYAVTEDGLLVVNSTWGDDSDVRIFDVTTGALLGTVSLILDPMYMMRGLVCMTNP